MTGLGGTRQRLNVLTLALLLSLTVFLWGLHYKVSLYYAQASGHAAPAAKLLSQRERPQSVEAIEHLLAQRDWPIKLPKSRIDNSALPLAWLVEQTPSPATSLVRTSLKMGHPRSSAATSFSPRAPPRNA
jgi:hypothetical protein